MALRVIVVGAGIAGLCAAVALRQAGHTVTIFEKSQFATEIGAALAVSPNGALVLQSIGFDFARARACRRRSWEVVDGTTLSRIAIQVMEEDDNKSVGFWTVHRVDLHQELLRLAQDVDPDKDAGFPTPPPPVEIRLASPVVDVDPVAGSVRLSDGSVHAADLVIGADGLHSAIRASVIPHLKSPVVTGMSAFRFLLPTEAFASNPTLERFIERTNRGSILFADTVDTVNERHLIWYSCRGGEVQNFAGIHPTRPNTSNSDFKSDMIEEFVHFHPSVREAMNLAEDVKCWPLLIHEPLHTWCFHKVLLIGDAAHAMLPFGGQGANQAIEDAGALAALFKSITPAGIPARLALFEEVRRKRASRVQVLSSVRVGREAEVQEQLKEFMEPGMPVPNTFSSRLDHDSKYNVLEECVRKLASLGQSYIKV
ncbi:hypothetical protein ASPZODRAFT_311372 [Penicilliopsis zonata CBS 506.65]|uniref:FAD-binding domain-containing protein n=1 Tax=Penicilliopsis zonata CBS 506.65 TaxID=1073090 RepID=A0A1L9SVB0_9EURO|nr:hypothetical protein ASPZODRAFT_311372 [Penicilliopsis zonata CBS 506.65]OJJ51051.1 hypothetical protein ASPZODRAFT_311372 [Penicilliopsis zonata CBS 506.65]